LLTGHGATVYIDKKDPALPPYTNKATAIGLKTRIQQSNKFVLLASKNSKESRWVPWELGIADQAKGLSRVAILPTVETQTDAKWSSWEYLGLYDRIVWGDLEGEGKRVWMVLDERKNTATKLSLWLRAKRSATLNSVIRRAAAFLRATNRSVNHSAETPQL